MELEILELDSQNLIIIHVKPYLTFIKNEFNEKSTNYRRIGDYRKP
jgi:hypothetical protein